MIKRTVEAANNHDIEIEVCGEIASDPVSAACLMGLGIRSLSMSPGCISSVKKLLLNQSIDDMVTLATQTLQCATPQEVELLFKNWNHNK